MEELPNETLLSIFQSLIRDRNLSPPQLNQVASLSHRYRNLLQFDAHNIWKAFIETHYPDVRIGHLENEDVQQQARRFKRIYFGIRLVDVFIRDLIIARVDYYLISRIHNTTRQAVADNPDIDIDGLFSILGETHQDEKTSVIRPLWWKIAYRIIAWFGIDGNPHNTWAFTDVASNMSFLRYCALQRDGRDHVNHQKEQILLDRLLQLKEHYRHLVYSTIRRGQTRDAVEEFAYYNKKDLELLEDGTFDLASEARARTEWETALQEDTNIAALAQQENITNVTTERIVSICLEASRIKAVSTQLGLLLIPETYEVTMPRLRARMNRVSFNN